MQVGVLEIRVLQVRVLPVGVLQVRILEIRILQVRVLQIRVLQIRVADAKDDLVNQQGTVGFIGQYEAIRVGYDRGKRIFVDNDCIESGSGTGLSDGNLDTWQR